MGNDGYKYIYSQLLLFNNIAAKIENQILIDGGPVVEVRDIFVFQNEWFFGNFPNWFFEKVASEWEDQGSKIDYKNVVKCTEY